MMGTEMRIKHSTVKVTVTEASIHMRLKVQIKSVIVQGNQSTNIAFVSHPPTILKAHIFAMNCRIITDNPFHLV